MYHTFLFDLDNTIYPESSGIMNAIRDRIIFYMKNRLGFDDEFSLSFRQYCLKHYGTTLKGLKEIYGIDEDEFLAYVHDIRLSEFIQPDNRIKEMLEKYHQKKVIFSNADSNHVKRVLKTLDLEQYFDTVIDVHSIKPYVKPQKESFNTVKSILKLTNWDGCVFIDDHLPNVQSAAELGIFSILVSENSNKKFPNMIPSILNLPYLVPYS